MNMHVPALQRSLVDVVAEYDLKAAAIDTTIATFVQAGTTLKMGATIGGTYGDRTLDTGDVRASEMRECLLRSAWKHIFEGLNIDRIASAEDKRKWQTAMEKPAPFTLDNIRGTFGHYIQDPRGNILRGLAEVFCRLDPAYRSHDKVKIGVQGLPKRVIIGNVGYSSSYGMDKLRDMLNALAAFEGKPLIGTMTDPETGKQVHEFAELDKLHSSFSPRAGTVTIRGIEVRKFQNGNAHVIFDKTTLRAVNKALAEFYGDVLPDTTDEKPAKKQAGTAVSKDLQYYPTPAALIEKILNHQFDSNMRGKSALEPNCGCGRIMDALRKRGADVFGVEVDAGRALQARAKGHTVLLANFLDTAFAKRFDIIAMNPPFYGKHYAKHVLHAHSLLAPGGILVAILPATARYDHGLLDELAASQGRYSSPWDDLPVGSFSESGTNINTCVLTIRRPS
jgi:SAM-dependent methyltransferase